MIDQKLFDSILFNIGQMEAIAREIDPATLEQMLKQREAEYRPGADDFYIGALRNALGYIRSVWANQASHGSKRVPLTMVDVVDVPGGLLVNLEEPEGERLGATGNFPLGQIGPSDQGELAVAVAVDRRNNRIHMDLGPSPIKWISMTTAEARAFADALRGKARELDGLDL